MKILLPVSCRSDDPLTRPMIDRLEKDDFFELEMIELLPADLEQSLVKMYLHFRYVKKKPDCILIMGDRIEMFAATVAAFHNNIPIIHYGSGITNTIATFDDINRHSIALMADVCLCEDKCAAQTISNIIHAIRGQTILIYEEGAYLAKNVHVVGNLYLDTIDDIDESLVPSEPYDLVLINPETLDKESELTPINIERKMILIGPNPDEGSTSLIDFRFPRGNLKTFSGGAFQEIYENLPRPPFLGLLKNCTRFITNSSSAYYEAPHFLKPEQIIQVGERNKNRSTPRTWNQDYKTSEKIVQIIKKWWNEKNEQ